MGWFGRKSAAAGPGAPLFPAWAGSGNSETFPRSYQARLDEVYVNNPVSRRAVRLVAGATAALPIYARTGEAQAAELVEQPALIETVAAQLLLHGNAFVQCVASSRGLAELFPLRPERLTIATNRQGWPAAYLYRVGAGQPKRFEAAFVPEHGLRICTAYDDMYHLTP